MTIASVIKLIPDTGILDQIFHQTFLRVSIGGFPEGEGYKVTLAGLIVLALVGLLAAAITGRLSGEKPGKNLVGSTLVAFFGAFLFVTFVRLPFEDISVESVGLISSLLGAVIFGVFYVLFRRQAQSRQKKSA